MQGVRGKILQVNWLLFPQEGKLTAVSGSRRSWLDVKLFPFAFTQRFYLSRMGQQHVSNLQVQIPYVMDTRARQIWIIVNSGSEKLLVL